MADALNITQRPHLRSPLLIAGFSGWNDAGEAASGAVRFMQRRWRAETVAEIDPEEFYDFSQLRPQVRLKDGERVVDWPPNAFSAKRVEHLDRDVILLSGIEPHLSWRAYVETVKEVCRTFDVGGAIILGALLGEASHARPVRVTGSSAAPWLADALDLDTQSRSTYEGPTGIVGVLTQALRDEGIPTASMWANIPFYVQRTPNPKGSLALLQRLNDGFDFQLQLHDLEVFAARFEAQVAADIEGNPEVAEYARRMADLPDDEDEQEEASPATPDELPDAASMIEDLDRFLRGRQGSDEDDDR